MVKWVIDFIDKKAYEQKIKKALASNDPHDGANILRQLD